MRICFIINQFHAGGAELLVSRLSKELANRGHKILLISLRKSDESTRLKFFDSLIADVDGLRVVEGVSDSVKHFRKTLNFLSCARREVRNFKPDIIHSHCEMPDIAAGILGGVCSARKVRTAHNEVYFQRARWVGRVLELVVTKVFNFSAVVAISKKIQIQNTILMTNKLVPLIYNGIDSFAVTPLNKINKSGMVKRVAIVGRLTSQKGQVSYIEFLKGKYGECLEGLPYEVHLYGDGPDKSRILASASSSEKIIIHGLVSDKAEIYSNKDVVLVPSRFEGLSTVMLESLAHGVPVITLNVSGATDVCVGYDVGSVVSDFDRMDAAVVCSEFSRIDDLKYKKLKCNFSLYNYVVQHENFYEHLIKTV